MKLLLTGATGFLGSRVRRDLQNAYAISTLPSALLRGELTAERVEQIAAEIAEKQPDVLFHTAAISSTVYAQEHPEESWQANVRLPQVLAGIAARQGCKFVFCSSDQVYGGCAGIGPFAEDVPLAPTNVYGRHKLESEALVAEAAPDAVALRMTWLYDLPNCKLPSYHNLLIDLLFAAARGEPLSLATNDYRGLTYVGELIANLPAAFKLPGGVYNFGGGSEYSTWQIARAWSEILSFAGVDIRPTERAPRSLCMDGGKAQAAGIVFADSIAGIKRCIADYGVDKL